MKTTEKQIAHAFNDGDPVTVKADATKRNGDPLPHAGKRGTIVGNPTPGWYMVDVPGLPVENMLSSNLEPTIAGGAPATVYDQFTSAAPGQAQGYTFEVLPLKAVVPSLTNPRTWFEPTALQELADSIGSLGLGQPILVRPLPGSRAGETFSDRRKGDPLPTHEIIAGERRYRACGIAGVRTVPVMIRNLSDEQVLRMQLIENVQREGLHALEEARGYRRILDLPAYADQPMATRVDALASEIKKSPRYIYVTLQLLKLCDLAQEVFQQGLLHRSVAKEIATIGNEAQQIEATQRIAGITRSKGKGTAWEVTNDPMSQRAAADYVRNNFRLVLSKAPFPIKVEYAGIAPCTGCDKMSANAMQLFDEGTKVPDTCMDPSCYGQKNAEHTKQLAEAAKAKGQRVITGKAAKKLQPYQDGDLHSDDLQALDDRRYDVSGNNYSKTVEQILGKDAPAPILIERTDGQGFIKALPKKDVDKLLKERGLLRAPTSSVSDEQRKAEKKAKEEKAYRWEVAEQLLAAVPKAGDQDALRSQLLLAMMIQLHQRLDNECTKRVHKMLRWEDRIGLHVNRPALETHFKAMDGAEINQFVVAACVASELHYAQYYHPGTDSLDALAELLKVDAKGIKARQAADAKAAEKAKADKSKKAAHVKDQRAKPVKKAAAKKTAAPAKVKQSAGSAKAAKELLAKTAGGHPDKGAMRKALSAASALKARPAAIDDVLGALAIDGVHTFDQLAQMSQVDLEGVACLTPNDASAVLSACKAKVKATAGKTKAAEQQQDLELPMPDKPAALNAWPFPLTKEETPDQARARAAQASKALKAGAAAAGTAA